MWFIIKKRLLWILKNPIYYIGAILVFLFIYDSIYSYLGIHYFKADSEIKEISVEYSGDADIMDGYIPLTEEERFIKGLESLRQDLLLVIGIDEKEVNGLIANIKGLDIEEAIKLIKEEYPYLGNPHNYFYINTNKKATVEEANSYIERSLEAEEYADYFGRKYADYLGVGIMFYCMIIYALFYSYDYKKDIYELLHTKPIAEWKYLLAKALGGVIAIGLVVAVVTISFQGMLIMNKSQMEFPVNSFRIWKYVLVCSLPCIVYASFLYLFISGLFRTPLPAIPILFLQILYSNQGVKYENGVYLYTLRPGFVFTRFPEPFFDTKFSNVLYLNQGILILLTMGIASLAIFQWRRKRV